MTTLRVNDVLGLISEISKVNDASFSGKSLRFRNDDECKERVEKIKSMIINMEDYLCRNHDDEDVRRSFKTLLKYALRKLVNHLDGDAANFDINYFLYVEWLPRWEELYPFVKDTISSELAEPLSRITIMNGYTKRLKQYLYNLHVRPKDERPKGVLTMENAKHHMDKVIAGGVDVGDITYGDVNYRVIDRATGKTSLMSAEVCFVYEFVGDYTYNVELMEALNREVEFASFSPRWLCRVLNKRRNERFRKDLLKKVQGLKDAYVAYVKIYSPTDKQVKILPKSLVEFKSYKNCVFRIAGEPWHEKNGEIVMQRDVPVYNLVKNPPDFFRPL